MTNSRLEEFIKGVYQSYDKEFEKNNFFNHKKVDEKSWYDGSTGILPLDHSIKNASNFAWTHHIERLMIQANVMNLCEIKPLTAYKWFMEHYGFFRMGYVSQRVWYGFV